MKKILLIIALLISGLGLNAQSATIGDLKFTVTSIELAECEVSGYSGEPVDVTIPSKVTKIGKQAFYGCKGLKSITIKTTKLKTSKLGSKAFTGTPGNVKVKVPKSKVKTYTSMLR